MNVNNANLQEKNTINGHTPLGGKRVHDNNSIDEPNNKKSKLLDPYEHFWDVIQFFKATWPTPYEMVNSVCKINELDQHQGIEKFKSTFTVDQIKQLSGILYWLYLLDSGKVPRGGLEDTKEYLGIDYCVEILDPSWTIKYTTNPVSLSYLSQMIEEAVHEPEIEFEQVKMKFLDFIDQDLTLRGSFYDELEMNDNVAEDLLKRVEDLDNETKLRLILLSSIVCYLLPHSNEGLTAKPDEFPSKISENLIYIIKKIDKALLKLRKGACDDKSSDGDNEDDFQNSGSFTKVRTSQNQFTQRAIIPLEYEKLNLPGMPNWMPNGGNSCYISSTLWPIFFLLNQEVRTKMPMLEMAEYADPDQKVNLARCAFIQFYKEMSSQEKQGINTSQVNLFRSAIQNAYPKVFEAPKGRAQEDAYEFLICMIKDVMPLDPFSKGAAEFLKRHIYTKSSNQELVEPEFYNYIDGSSYCKEELHTVDIVLGVKANGPQTLNRLVTGEHRTEDIEKNAYKNVDDHNGPRYRSFTSQHSEQFVVESEQNAPNYFIGRLARFSSSNDQGSGQHKRFDVVVPNATLEFFVKDRELEDVRVRYDLVAITNHSGGSLYHGHYYTYMRTLVDNQWRFVKYCDIDGPSECRSSEAVIQDAAINGYIFYYKKREANEPAPTPVPFEDDPSKVEGRKNAPASSSTSSSTSTSTSTVIWGGSNWNLTPTSPSLPNTKTSKAEQWIIENKLSDVFQIHPSRQVFDSLRALFISHFPDSLDVISMIDDHVGQAEYFKTASDFLAIPIYHIDAYWDDEMVVDSNAQMVKPGASYIYGQDITTNPNFYVFQQPDGRYSVIQKIAKD